MKRWVHSATDAIESEAVDKQKYKELREVLTDEMTNSLEDIGFRCPRWDYLCRVRTSPTEDTLAVQVQFFFLCPGQGESTYTEESYNAYHGNRHVAEKLFNNYMDESDGVTYHVGYGLRGKDGQYLLEHCDIQEFKEWLLSIKDPLGDVVKKVIEQSSVSGEKVTFRNTYNSLAGAIYVDIKVKSPYFK